MVRLLFTLLFTTILVGFFTCTDNPFEEPVTSIAGAPADTTLLLGDSLVLTGSSVLQNSEDEVELKWNCIPDSTMLVSHNDTMIFYAKKTGKFTIVLTGTRLSVNRNTSAPAYVTISVFDPRPNVSITLISDSTVNLNDTLLTVTEKSVRTVKTLGNNAIFTEIMFRRISGEIPTSIPSCCDSIFTDTLYTFDTLIVHKKNILIDTIFIADTQITYDSANGTIVLDVKRFAIIDTILVEDTLSDPDTIIRLDTLIVRDTINSNDTLWKVHNIEVYDTLIYRDTALIGRGLIINDTIIAHDTLRIRVTETKDDSIIKWSWTINGRDTSNAIADTVILFSSSKPGIYKLFIKAEHQSGKVDTCIVNITVQKKLNSIPVATINNKDTIIQVGDTLTIDGSTSTDEDSIDQHKLKYHWGCYGSGTLYEIDSSVCRFDANKAGNFLISLNVFDGKDSSTNDFVQVTVKDSAHAVASAGKSIKMFIGDTTDLDGSKSFGGKGELLYIWTSSGGTLIGAATANPKFTTNSAGTYQISLQVGDGANLSTPAHIFIVVVDTVTLPLPQVRAFLKGDTTISLGDTAQINGLASQDSSQIQVVYSWNAPYGGEISNTNSGKSLFTADSEGTYLVTLRVSDSSRTLWSSYAWTLIRVKDRNSAPAANAGIDTTIAIGQELVLRGSGTDPDGDSILSYLWQCQNGGNLAGPSTPQPTFSSSNSGNFVLSLQVGDGKLNSEPDYITITVIDTQGITIPVDSAAAVARAGNSLKMFIGDTIELDGSKSNGGGGTLEFSWTSDGGKLIDSATVAPKFTADSAGTYRITLQVRDNTYLSAPDYIFIIVLDTSHLPSPRVSAFVKGDTIIEIGDTVQIDGTASQDSSQVQIIYMWNTPYGGELINSGSGAPLFTADSIGAYLVTLRVTDSSNTLWSTYAWAQIRVEDRNLPPAANAGADTTIVIGQNLVLAGFGIDPDGDTILSYDWQCRNGGNLIGSTSCQPIFSSPFIGKFVLSLRVSDGKLISGTDYITITVIDTQKVPLAEAGLNDTIFLGDSAQLDGSGSSDPNGENVQCIWSLPDSGVLSDVHALKPWFKADRAGQYVILLRVTDGRDTSASDWVKIIVRDTIAASTNRAPVANAGSTASYPLGIPVILDGSGSYDPDGDILTYIWRSATSNPDQSFSLDSTVKPTFSPTISGTYCFMLYIYDGDKYSEPSQVVITVLQPDWTVSMSRTGPIYKKTVREALDAASEGDTIFVEPGTFNETGECIFKDGILLFGAGPDLSTVNLSSFIFYLYNVNNVTIRGLTVQHGGETCPPPYIKGSNIACHNASFITIENCRSIDGYGDGIRLYEATGVTISSCVISGNTSNGIRANTSAFQVLNSSISDNGAESSDYSGVAIEDGATTITLQSDTLRDNLPVQIKLCNPANFYLEDCYLTGDGGGVSTTHNSGVKLYARENKFVGNTGSSIYCWGNATVTIELNTFDNTNGGVGNKAIDLINCSGTISTNTISKYFIGINLATSGVSLSNNTYINNQTHLKVIGVPCPTVTGNTLQPEIPPDYSESTCTPP